MAFLLFFCPLPLPRSLHSPPLIFLVLIFPALASVCLVEALQH